VHRAISHRLHKNISVITLKPQGLVYLFYMKFGRSGVFTAGNDIGDFLQAAMAKDDIARPRNPVTFLQSPVNNKKPIIAAVDGIAIGIGTTMAFSLGLRHCKQDGAAFQSLFLKKK
jgi:enoyl-CoA hydratase/carnithine racemase